MSTLTENRYFKKGLLVLFIACAIFWAGFCWGTGMVETAIEEGLRGFTLILWSVLLEALPFVLLGTVISSLIQVFVTEDMILKVLPKSTFLRLVMASMIGLVFPVCECAIIPITRGLLKKGMPRGPAFAFMIATPIVNPIVLLSTYNAFPTMPEMMIYRALGGLIGAIAIGALVNKADGKPLLKEKVTKVCACGCDHQHHDHDDHETNDAHEREHMHENQCSQHEHEIHTSSNEHEHQSNEHQDEQKCCEAHHHNHDHKNVSVFQAVITHTSIEIQSVGMYLIFGAMIAAAMQMLVPTEVLTSIGSGRVLSIAVMMLIAFVLSLCSEADAFIASTFILQFSEASVLAFLITGPMIDIKNTLMMLGSFRRGFVIRLIATILLVCFVLALIASYFIGGSYA